jgi:Mrp family chromosome partitioning ATPase
MRIKTEERMSNNYELLSQLELADRFFPRASDSPLEPRIDSKVVENGGLPSSYSEALNLVQRVYLANPDLAPNVVVFTSPQRGAGCSWVCARISETLAARLPGSVCVVDANLRSPAVHRYFRLDNRRGLTQALAETNPITDYVREVRSRKVSVLTTGSSSGQLTAWASDRLIQRLTELRQRFTFLLIDAPAMNLYADVTLLSSVTDAAILVLEADSTRREAAVQARDALVAAKFRLIGAALNKRSFPIPEFVYRRL